MSLVQKVNGENRTFGELSETLFLSALHLASEGNRIDVVFDVYKDMSIKNAERVSRGEDTGILFCNIASGHRIKQWRRLLSSSASKTNLVKYITENWKRPRLMSHLLNKVMYVTCESQCFKLTNCVCTTVEDLQSTHEEADTRMFLHAKHAAADSTSVILVAEDTDVFILSLAMKSNIDSNVFIKCGTKNRERFIDVSKVAAALGSDVCDALPGMHSFTGCDTVSAFSGRGKLAALKLVINNKVYRDAFSQLGKAWMLPESLFVDLQSFTCRLYASRSTIDDVNELRYHLFRAKKGQVESGQLPPCRDCLYMHTLRANYQAAVWHRSLERTPIIPNPTNGHGWMDEDGQLAISWMTGSPAPDVVLEFLSCKCRKACKLPDCQCLANGLKCMAACSLQTCDNMKDDDCDYPDEDDSDSDSDY